MSSKIAVIGAGIFGASTALELADRGHRVTLVEQFDQGDSRTTSNGLTRNIRFSHAGDEWYTRSAWMARSLWKELENRLSTELMVECGVAWFSHDEDGWGALSLKTLESEGIPVERIDPSEGERLYPSFNGDDLSFIVFEPTGGILRARKSVNALRSAFSEMGGNFIQGRAENIGGRVMVNGTDVGGDIVVWACGPWIPLLFDLGMDLQVTTQEVIFFESPPEWDAPNVPAYTDIEEAFYGCGGCEGRPFKLASDVRGKEFNPDKDERELSKEQLKWCKDYLTKRFPDLSGAKVKERRLCQYTSTSDSNWIIAQVPGFNHQWIVGAGSGHGFKHGPALGKYVADLIEEKTKPETKFAINERPYNSGGWLHLYNKQHL